jgi:hypothetical protein
MVALDALTPGVSLVGIEPTLVVTVVAVVPIGDAFRVIYFKLTVEAKRIDLAFLFDPMMAVHTSNVEPLPHQITAVYESMLPRQPLRFVLADDPARARRSWPGSTSASSSCARTRGAS